MSSPDALPPAAPPSSPRSTRSSGLVRSLMESMICLALAVIIFRTFEVEGYMISTGSMAPHLLGFHKRTVCPSCRWEFTCGVLYDDSVADSDSGAHATGDAHEDPLHAVCPNCGLTSIDLSSVSRNHGDQLLVSKCAYQFENPRRWEVVVFRNPYKPTQAYVKRVVGLPGEAIRVVHGDVTINGEIQRKPLEAQRALRIPVHDSAHEPSENDSEDWQPRWQFGENAAWSQRGGGFRFDDLDPKFDERPRPEWLSYRHWIRLGGSHTTTVLLSDDAPNPVLPDSPFSLLKFNEESRTILCVGALPQERCNQLQDLNPHPLLQEAFERLYEESHITAVTDDYGYNRLSSGMVPVPVRDLMLAAQLRFEDGEGTVTFEMGDGRKKFTFEVDFGAREVRLLVDGPSEPVRKAALPLAFSQGGTPVLVEMSLFDRQVLVACDGQTVFAPLPLEDVAAGQEPETPPRRPVRIGARHLRMTLDSVVLYRDVHYTRGKARNGVEKPYALDDHSYFMLGDNSPVSSDSRNWQDGAVRQELLLGKPFVVHLPSKPAHFEFGGHDFQIRIPDVSQIRYIR